jgi:Transposase DDE domain
MRYNQRTLKASTVHAYANHLLMQTLELEDYTPVLPMKVVASVLILAACWQTSLTGACRMVQSHRDHGRVREVVYACLPPKPRDLLARLLVALRQTLPDHLLRGPRVMALDMHQRPYYGKGTTKGCTRRQKKDSTRKSFTYATLAVLDRSGRYTVGLLPMRPYMRLTTVIEELLKQAQEVGLQISYLLLDKEFYAAEAIALLQKKQVSFLMPAVKKGSAGTGNAYLFEPTQPVGWCCYTWTAPRRRWDFQAKKRRQHGTITVTVKMCVARCAKKGGVKEPVVYAAWGLGKDWSPAQVVETYRKRFGIETSYRQLGQCLAQTSSPKEKYRLLLVGLALLLCNLWANLHSEVFGSGPVSERTLHLERARLNDMIAGVAAVIAASLGGWVSEWPMQGPLPDKLVAFQT